MYNKPKKEISNKYIRKGMMNDDDSSEDERKKKGKRRIRKPKSSVHTKTGRGKNK